MKPQGLNDLPRTLTTTPYELSRAILQAKVPAVAGTPLSDPLDTSRSFAAYG